MNTAFMTNHTRKPNPKNEPLGNTTSIASQNPPVSREEKAILNTVIRYYLQSLAIELMPDERVSVCLRCMTPIAQGVKVLKKMESKRAYYSGLMVCGSVWMCPVCAAHITEQRRQELTAALALTDLVPLLATYTLRHNREDKLADLLPDVLDSYRKMKSGKAWQELKDEYGWIGSIRSLEITHGDNGWHPHIHELILVDRRLSKSAQNGLLVDLKGKWTAALARSGHDASYERGVDLRSTDRDIQEYVAKFGREPIVTKWSLEHELTKQPVKRGRKNGRTPMQLLADYGDGDIRAGRLWQQYAKVFKGRNQLVWSRGLRDLLHLGAELDDQALAEALPDNLVELAFLTKEQWWAILRADVRGELLEAAGTLSYDDFQDWLNNMLEKWL